MVRHHATALLLALLQVAYHGTLLVCLLLGHLALLARSGVRRLQVPRTKALAPLHHTPQRVMVSIRLHL